MPVPKRTTRIACFLWFGIILLSPLQAQVYLYPGHYDNETNQYVLNPDYFDNEANYRIFDQYLNQAFFSDTLTDTTFNLIADHDLKNNVYTLLLIGEQISDELSLKSNHWLYTGLHATTLTARIFYALSDRKYYWPIQEYYYKELPKNNIANFNFISNKFGSEELSHFLFEDKNPTLLINSMLSQANRKYNPDRLGYFLTDHSEMVCVYYSDDSINHIIPVAYHYDCPNSLTLHSTEYTVTTSSALSNAYTATNLTDYSLKTTWAEGDAGNGVGEWFEITFDAPQQVGEIVLFAGYGKSEALFEANNRAKTVRVTWNGQEQTVDLRDCFCAQSLPIHDTTERIRITITDVYPGTRYNDLCISEILLFRDEY